MKFRESGVNATPNLRTVLWSRWPGVNLVASKSAEDSTGGDTAKLAREAARPLVVLPQKQTAPPLPPLTSVWLSGSTARALTPARELHRQRTCAQFLTSHIRMVQS